MIQINENIALLRKERGITQEELARALGVTNQAVSKWEAGKCCPDIDVLPDLASYFQVSIDELMGYRPASQEPPSHAQDALLGQALEIAKETGQIHTSILQRKLCIGYTKAISLINALVDGGYLVRDESKRHSYVLTRN